MAAVLMVSDLEAFGHMGMGTGVHTYGVGSTCWPILALQAPCWVMIRPSEDAMARRVRMS